MKLRRRHLAVSQRLVLESLLLDVSRGYDNQSLHDCPYRPLRKGKSFVRSHVSSVKRTHRAILGLVAAMLGLGAIASLRAIAADPPAPAAPPVEGKAYTQKIPGADVSFNMVPIPAGKFMMGSPETEKKRKADEGPQFTVASRAVLDGCRRSDPAGICGVYRQLPAHGVDPARRPFPRTRRRMR